METMEGMTVSAISDTSRLPFSDAAPGMAAAFKRLAEVFSAAAVLSEVSVGPMSVLTAWKEPAATLPKSAALKVMAPIFFTSFPAFPVFIDLLFIV